MDHGDWKAQAYANPLLGVGLRAALPKGGRPRRVMAARSPWSLSGIILIYKIPEIFGRVTDGDFRQRLFGWKERWKMRLDLREWSGNGDLRSGCGAGQETLRQQSIKLNP